MNLKIISDGTSAGTKIIDTDTGEKIGLVQKITWLADSSDPQFTKTTIEILNLPVEMETMAKITAINPETFEETTRGRKVKINSTLDTDGSMNTQITDPETNQEVPLVQSAQVKIAVPKYRKKNMKMLERTNSNFDKDVRI